jgi:hypothetical protein
MKVRCTVEATYEVVVYGVELDVPDDIAEKGEEAITEWAKHHASTVDYAKFSHRETCGIVSVAEVRDVK